MFPLRSHCGSDRIPSLFICRAQLPTRPTAPSAPEPSAAVAAALLSLAALPAVAEEFPDADASVNVAKAAAPSIFGFTPLGLLISFSPVIVYGAFYLYREKINPRAKVS